MESAKSRYLRGKKDGHTQPHIDQLQQRTAPLQPPPQQQNTHPWTTHLSPSCSLLRLAWCEGHEGSVHPLQHLTTGTHTYGPSSVGLSFGSAQVSYPVVELLPAWQLQPRVSPHFGVLFFQPAPLGSWPAKHVRTFTRTCTHTHMHTNEHAHTANSQEQSLIRRQDTPW